MTITFDDVQQKGVDLQNSYARRDALFTEMEQMYFMIEPDEANMRSQMNKLKLTLSPDMRNQLLGAVRLLTATDPQFSVGYDINNSDAKRTGEPIERFAKRMWQAAGKIAGTPIHYDAILSAMLYGEVHMGVISTRHLQARAKGGDIARTKAAARRTPYLFEVLNPRGCYTEWDMLGMSTHFRRTSTTVSKVRGAWGQDLLPKYNQLSAEVFLCEYWDAIDHCVYVEGERAPILNEEHNLPFIPVHGAIVEGSSSLFGRNEDQTQPFLYSAARSGLWNRQNLGLTVLYTMLFAIGSNPMFIYKANQANKKIKPDYSRPGGVLTIESNEEYGPLLKAVIDPSLLQGLQIAGDKLTESTIYKQALGQPLAGNSTFSTISLLSQSGRLPLISPKTRLEWVFSQTIETALQWMRLEGGMSTARYEGDSDDLKAKDIPEDLEISTSLEINLPQDKLQMANIANLMTSGEDPLVSHRWAREEILGVGQSQQMTKEIWSERTEQIKATQYFADQMNQARAKLQAAMQPPDQGSGLQSQEPGQGGPPEPPGLQGGLPPVMAQGGMQEPYPAQGEPPQGVEPNGP